MSSTRLTASRPALPVLPVRPCTSRPQLRVRAAAQSHRSEVSVSYAAFQVQHFALCTFPIWARLTKSVLQVAKPLAVAGLVATTLAAAPAAQAAMELMTVAEVSL